MPDLFYNFIPLIFGVLSLIILILYLKEYNLRKRSQNLSDQLLEQTQQKGYQILHQAVKQAQDILSTAELEGIKIVAGSKISAGKLDQQYEQRLTQSIQTSQNALSQETSTARVALQTQEAEFGKFLNDLRTRASQMDSQTQQTAQMRINQLFAQFEERLSNFLVKTESQTTTSIELELKSARQLIDTYKNQQLALIDENIIAMMEQTLSIVLAKKLSLKDQLDLVYEALEKAKVEKFIV
jgi:hypothetical protein